MAVLNVNPTRAEMRTLMEKLQIAARGHTLLKEKQDSLIRRFVKLIDRAKAQRRKTEMQLDTIFSMYQEASLVTEDEVLEKILQAAESKLDIQVKLSDILGIKVPRYEYQREAKTEHLSSIFLTPKCWEQMESLEKALTKELILLAEMEKKCYLLGQEIIITRRRVNALKYKTIPDLEETIESIKLKIEDADRNQIAKMIKLK